MAKQIEELRAITAIRHVPSEFTMDAIARATGFDDAREVRSIGSIISEAFPGNHAFPSWKASATAEDVAERAKAAMPILTERRAAEERRREVAETHRRNREAKLARSS